MMKTSLLKNIAICCLFVIPAASFALSCPTVSQYREAVEQAYKNNPSASSHSIPFHVNGDPTVLHDNFDETTVSQLRDYITDVKPYFLGVEISDDQKFLKCWYGYGNWYDRYSLSTESVQFKPYVTRWEHIASKGLSRCIGEGCQFIR